MQQKFFKIPFANTGDKTTIPNAGTDSDPVNFEKGWTPPYEGKYGSDPGVLAVSRGSTNALMNDVTGAIGALQSVGVPEWITVADNDGVAFEYALGAHVLYQGQEYVSAVDNNTATPGEDASWQPFNGVSAQNILPY